MILLQDVGEFVRKQAVAPRSPGRELAISEYNVRAEGISQSVDRPRRFRRLCVRMQAHLAEAVAEAGLHEGARLRIQRLTGRA
jgi:hypothetical protein